MSAPLVTFVSFGASARGDAVRESLIADGYSVIPRRGADWLDSRVPRHPVPLVLFLAEPGCPRDRIVDALKVSAQVTLGIHDAGVDPVEEEILRNCSEVLFWPCRREELRLRLERIAPRRVPEMLTENDSALLTEFLHLNMVGRSPAFVGALRHIRRLARCDAPVLIEGETGTGKEMAARAVHYLSARRDRPFIPVNCGAIPDNLFENEMFGHVRGAFTDAKEAQPGLVALAEGGTLFLDEIEALSAKAQVALLRFLQDRQYRVLGGRAIHQADVRVVAAGNQDLAERARNGQFREDLYFRLEVASLRLPPLREREGDVTLLAEHFAARYGADYQTAPKTLHPSTLRWLRAHAWPGNVRELENFIHRQFLMNDDAVIRFQGFAPARERRRRIGERRGAASTAKGFQDAKRVVVAQFEKTYLADLITQSRGNVTAAAHRARVERRALGKLLKKHDIDPSRYRER